ncbi:MAG: hypothetical protein IJK26_06495 [Clostridia bacterium]|nr:hypothetical protein [Clostridia bacterium]
MKRIISAILVFSLLFSLPLNIFAYKRGGNLCVDVTKSSMPKDTAFIDLLIELDEASPDYILCNDEEIITFDGQIVKLQPEFEIVQYNDDEGFVSYSAHYKEAFVFPYFTYDEYNGTPYDVIEVSVDEDYLELREKYPNVKIAYVSAGGKVLTVSNAVSIMDKNSVIEFDSLTANRAKLEVVTYKNPYLIMAYTVIGVAAAAAVSVTAYIIAAKKKRKNATAQKSEEI